MNDKIHNITSKQLMVFIISAQAGLGTIILPSQLAESTGHDGWISVLLCGALSTIALIVIIALLKRYSNKSILDINQLLYGKYIGKFFNLIIIIYFYFGAVTALRLLTEIVKLTVLKLTPPIILSFFIIIPTVYLTWSGLKAICRFFSVIFFIMLWVLFYFLLILEDFRPVFLLPIGEAGIKPILQSVFPTFIAFLGFELITIAYPYVKDKEKVMKWSITANIISTAFFTLVVIFTTGVYGEHMIKILEFPLFQIASIYEAPVLERLDLFFISIWIPAMIFTLSSYFFIAYHSMNHHFNIKNKKVFYVFFLLTIIFLARIPKDFIEAFEFSNVFLIFGISIIGFLIITAIFSLINKRGVIKK